MAPRKTTRAAETLRPAEARMEPIAIVGMSGRFPGANDVDQLWTNVAHGVESIAILTQEEMRAALSEKVGSDSRTSSTLGVRMLYVAIPNPPGALRIRSLWT